MLKTNHFIHLHLRREECILWSEQVSLSKVLLNWYQIAPAQWLWDFFKEW